MADPITFKPQPVDYHKELMQRVEAAPREHAEALEEKEPPSLWMLLRRSTSRDARRGLSFLTSLLVALGRAAKR